MSNKVAEKPKRLSAFLGKEVDILDGPPIKSMVNYAIPLMLMAMLSNLYSLADIAVVGNLADTVAVASVGATTTIIGLLVNLFLAIGTGYGVILIRVIGANDSFRITRAIKTGYTFSLLLGVLIAVVGIIFAKPMLLLTKCPDDVIDGATLYLRIYMLGAPATTFYNFNCGIIRSKGDTLRPFVYSAVAGGANVILNVVLILLTGNAVASVAIATVASMWISALLLFFRLIKLDAPFRLRPFDLGINGDVFVKILKYGVPAMITSASFSIANIQIQSAINSFGASGISGNTASINIEGFVFAITNSMCTVTATFAGQSIGAGRRERTLDVIKKSYIFWNWIAVAVSVLMFFFGEYLLGLIIPGETEAIAFGELRLKYIAVATTMHGLMNINAGFMQAFGKTALQMIVNLIGTCGFRLFWMLVIYPISPTPGTLYLCFPISYVLLSAVGIVFVLSMVRDYKKGKEFAI